MADHDTHDHTGVTGVPSATAPNPTTIELGHASDTTLSRASAGVVAVEGTNLVKAGAATGSGITMATARLLGRTTASSGAIEEITVGSGLSLAAGALTATGGSGTNLESGKVTRTAGDVTTTSTSFTDLTGASITFTTGARRVMLTFTGAWYHSGTSTMAIDFDVDGARAGGDFGLASWNVNHLGQAIPITITFLTDVLSAASHTFKVQWKVTAGTGTMQAATASSAYTFAAVELYAD